MLFVIIGLTLLVVLLTRRKSNRSIGEVAPGTMIIHHADGSKSEREYGSGKDEYYHQETAADYLCTPDKYSRIEIKDETGKVYSYDQAAMDRLGWN